jgi:hypothetical protein
MSVNFPANPTPNQVYTNGGRSWTWTGIYWRSTSLATFGSITVGGNLTVTGNASISGTLADSTGYTGSAGQVLTSTGSGLQWANGGTGGVGGASNVPIKTFNILGDFGLLTGTARFYPATQDTIKSVLLAVGVIQQVDLMVALYRNNQFLQFFSITAGTTYAKYTGLNYIIQTNESYTVNVVAGNGTNFSMGFFNINL